jgi:short-subunit dehydrogenase
MRHVVITGGADGIGRAVAAQYAASGARITLIDRDHERAMAVREQLAAGGQPTQAIIADLGDMAAIERCLHELHQLPPIDLIVYSAGISAVGAFATTRFDRQRAVVDLNLRAPLLLTAGLLQRQHMAPGGVFVFLASLSIFTAYPGASGYAASKAGIAAYARSLRVAVAKQGMHVLVVAPGPTRTAHARRYSPDNRRERYRMAPEQVARLIAHAVAKRQHLLIPGFGNRCMAWLGRYIPGLAEWLMRKTIFERLSPHL